MHALRVTLLRERRGLWEQKLLLSVSYCIPLLCVPGKLIPRLQRRKINMSLEKEAAFQAYRSQ